MLYSAIVGEILPEIPGCPEFTIERAIRDSAVEFFDSTLAYTVDQDPEPVFAGLDVVDLALPTGTRLVQVLRAQIGARPLDRLTRDQLMTAYIDWKAATGRPAAITFDSDTSVRLVPACDQTLDESLYLRFAVTPTRTSTSIADAVGDRYYREIVAGAKSRLWLMPDRVWSDQQLGTAYRALYERYIREAKLTEAQDRIAATKKVRLRRVV